MKVIEAAVSGKCGIKLPVDQFMQSNKHLNGRRPRRVINNKCIFIEYSYIQHDITISIVRRPLPQATVAYQPSACGRTISKGVLVLRTGAEGR